MFRIQVMSILAVGIIALAACGGSGTSTSDGGDSSAAAPTKRAVATMPSAQFQSVGEQSGITETIAISETTDSETDVSPDIALGARVYENRCAECHGQAGTGGSAEPLSGLAMEVGAFETLLRTGGEIGPDHLFGTLKVSENGLVALHAYLVSLE